MKLAIARSFTAAFVALVLTSGLASAAAQSTPAVMEISAKESSARVLVMAGSTGAEAGFTVDWIKKSDFDANGGAWPAAGDPRLHTGDFYGAPVWILQGSSGDFTLPPLQWQAVEPGELFDESGVATTSTDELAPSTDYVLRVKAKASGGYTESAPTVNLFVTTAAQAQNCTYTQGFWKTHSGAWPAGTIKLGNITYTSGQLLSIFNQPAGGNGLLILAHQLIAAKLNILQGADGSSVASTIASADALIGNLVSPPVGGGSLSPSSVNALATTLDNFNNGLIGPGHCGTTPATVSTWGSLKATYRR